MTTAKGNELATPLKLDLLSGNKVIVECKAAHQIHEVYKARLLTYLWLTGLNPGQLINFGSVRVKDRNSRMINVYL